MLYYVIDNIITFSTFYINKISLYSPYNLLCNVIIILNIKQPACCDLNEAKSFFMKTHLECDSFVDMRVGIMHIMSI